MRHSSHYSFQSDQVISDISKIIQENNKRTRDLNYPTSTYKKEVNTQIKIPPQTKVSDSRLPLLQLKKRENQATNKPRQLANTQMSKVKTPHKKTITRLKWTARHQ